MEFSIKGTKTRVSGENVCKKCQNSVVFCGQKFSEEHVYCQVMEQYTPYPIEDCSHFEAKNSMKKWEMERIAWKIGLDKKTKKIGFYTPQDFRTKKNDGLITDPGTADPEDDF